jgi:hypothetical protein
MNFHGRSLQQGTLAYLASVYIKPRRCKVYSVLCRAGVTTLLVSILAAVPAYAGGSCSFIKDPSQRALCRATTSGSIHQCSFISEADLRAFCRAQVAGKRSYCAFIRADDQRAYCRAVVG